MLHRPDRRIIAARRTGTHAELDEAKRQEMYTEMQRLVRDEGGVVVPLFDNYVMALSTKVGHEQMGNTWSLDGFRAVERRWFK